MGGIDLFKLLKQLHEAGYTAMTVALAALLAVGYVHWFEGPAFDLRLTGQEKQVTQIREGQLESKLDQTYAALCMNPGDPALLERIRDLQAQFQEVTQHKYDPPGCALLLKIK